MDPERKTVKTNEIFISVTTVPNIPFPCAAPAECHWCQCGFLLIYAILSRWRRRFNDMHLATQSKRKRISNIEDYRWHQVQPAHWFLDSAFFLWQELVPTFSKDGEVDESRQIRDKEWVHSSSPHPQALPVNLGCELGQAYPHLRSWVWVLKLRETTLKTFSFCLVSCWTYIWTPYCSWFLLKTWNWIKFPWNSSSLHGLLENLTQTLATCPVFFQCQVLSSLLPPAQG